MREAWRKREREKKRGQSDQASPNKKDNQMGSILCTINTITSLNASNLVGERERERERERGNGEQSSRGVGRVGIMAAVNSRDKIRLEKRSSCRA